MGRRIVCVHGGATLMAFFSEKQWIDYQSLLQSYRDGSIEKFLDTASAAPAGSTATALLSAAHGH